MKIWSGIANEEISSSEFVRSLGLLSVNNKKVNISISKNSSVIPAYISKSFESLKLSGIFIYDENNYESTH